MIVLPGHVGAGPTTAGGGAGTVVGAGIDEGAGVADGVSVAVRVREPDAGDEVTSCGSSGVGAAVVIVLMGRGSELGRAGLVATVFARDAVGASVT